MFTLGDNAYDSGSPAEFRDCYDPTWGRVKDRTELPVPGNHDYGTANAAGLSRLLRPRATPDGDTWYSRDIGDWHVIVLDANCTEITGGCGPGSPQLRWLRQDLRASDAALHARAVAPAALQQRGARQRSVGRRRSGTRSTTADADLILNGHDHDYERFAPQDPDGDRDPERGIVEIVVGTGRRRDARRRAAGRQLDRAPGPPAGRDPGHPARRRLVVAVHLDRRLVHGRGQRGRCH